MSLLLVFEENQDQLIRSSYHLEDTSRRQDWCPPLLSHLNLHLKDCKGKQLLQEALLQDVPKISLKITIYISVEMLGVRMRNSVVQRLKEERTNHQSSCTSFRFSVEAISYSPPLRCYRRFFYKSRLHTWGSSLVTS